MATIKDVARLSGLSVGTVSRYLNGETLKRDNQKLIEHAIKELGYETNLIARSMKTGKTMTIAVIVPYLSNMFSMRVIESIERILMQYNYCVIISDCSADPAIELTRLEFLKSRQVDGFVLMPTGNNADKIKNAVGDTPLILIDRLLDKPMFDSVVIDNEKMAYQSVSKLLEQGIREIGIIEGPNHISTARERKIGFERALKDYSIDNKYRYCSKEYSFEQGYHGMKQLNVYPLEAIFASNYELTVGAVSANEKSDLKILGFDTLDIPVRFYENYTGIMQPIGEIGEIAAKLLLERMKDNTMPIVNRVIG